MDKTVSLNSTWNTYFMILKSSTNIGMDFVFRLLRTQCRFDAMCVVIDKFLNMVYCIPYKTNDICVIEIFF